MAYVRVVIIVTASIHEVCIILAHFTAFSSAYTRSGTYSRIIANRVLLLGADGTTSSPWNFSPDLALASSRLLSNPITFGNYFPVDARELLRFWWLCRGFEFFFAIAEPPFSFIGARICRLGWAQLWENRRLFPFKAFRLSRWVRVSFLLFKSTIAILYVFWKFVLAVIVLVYQHQLISWSDLITSDVIYAETYV